MMKRNEVGAIVGACMMLVGPFAPAAYIRGSGTSGLIDKTWSYFDCAGKFALLIELMGLAAIALVLLKQVKHATWCGLIAIAICILVSPFPTLAAYTNDLTYSGVEWSGGQGLGWGIFVTGAGALITAIAGMFEFPLIRAER
jgi:hypothetical protein